jgi:hypothetical protein
MSAPFFLASLERFGASSDGDPRFLALFGVVLIGMAVFYACTGKIHTRYGDWIYRSKAPREFWESVVWCALVGLWMICTVVFDFDRDNMMIGLCIAAGLYCIYRLVLLAIGKETP